METFAEPNMVLAPGEIVGENWHSSFYWCGALAEACAFWASF